MITADLEIDLYLTAKENNMEFKRTEEGVDIIYFSFNLDWRDTYYSLMEVLHMHKIKPKHFTTILSADHIIYSITF
jgi:hypothetical protein